MRCGCGRFAVGGNKCDRRKQLICSTGRLAYAALAKRRFVNGQRAVLALGVGVPGVDVVRWAGYIQRPCRRSISTLGFARLRASSRVGFEGSS